MIYSKVSCSTDCVADTHRMHRLYEAADGFDSSPELAKRVYYMGTPRFTDINPTAALSTDGGKVSFEFNRSFFDGLGPEELIFVLLHETLHYALRHHQRCHDRIPALWNIACDLVVNAILLHEFGFSRIMTSSFKTFISSAITFENIQIVQNDRQLTLTAEEVYQLLGKKGKHVLAKTGTLNACDGHTWMESYRKGSPQEMDLSNEIAQQAEKIFREFAASCGHHALGEMRVFTKLDLLPIIEWEKILRYRIASCIDEINEQRWAPPNRRIAWLYPKVLLPTETCVEKPHVGVLLAIDSSGSITPNVLERLVAIASSIPREKVNLSTISFDTEAYEIDIFHNTHQVYGGGGTSFDAVEKCAQQSKQYPDLIIVLTDGIAPRPKVKFPQRWFWLITHRGLTHNIEGIGNYCKIGI